MPSSSPFFSVILPTFNRGHLLEDTIQGVLTQEFTNFELIIIDDASTDNTQEILRKLHDPRMLSIINPKNLERSASRNLGIDCAKGQYICFCDSDDHWKKNHLSTLYKTIETNPSAIFISTLCRYIENGKATDELSWNQGHKAIENCRDLIFYNEPPPSSSCYQKQAAPDLRFNPSLTVNEDVDFFCRLVNKTDSLRSICLVESVTVSFFIHNQNTRAQYNDFIARELSTKKQLVGRLHISKRVAHEKLKSCRHRHVNSFKKKEPKKIIPWAIALVGYLVRYPKDKTNKSKVYDFLHKGLRIL